MRRFSSEGSLLDLDFLPWKKVALKNKDNEKRESGIYTPHQEYDELDGRSADLTPTIQEPRASSSREGGKRELTKDRSISTENLSERVKVDKSHLGVCLISESCRAYSDSQLAPGAQGSTESVEKDELPSPSPSSSSSSNPFFFKSHHRQHHKPKLSAAKLHLRGLFGQVGY